MYIYIYTFLICVCLHKCMFKEGCVGAFSIACGRMGQTSAWTSLTVCKNSQAWVSLTNLLILWISTQSCDNDTSWVDLTGRTAGGRGGKPICSCKDWGESLITNYPQRNNTGRRNISLCLRVDGSFPLLSPWVPCFPVCRYGCMNLLQAQRMGCAASLRAGTAQVPQSARHLIDKPPVRTCARYISISIPGASKSWSVL